MKKVILNEPSETILPRQLLGREIIVYLSSKTNTPKMLCNITDMGHRPDSRVQRWGFISQAYPTGDVVFASDTFHDAVEKALKSGRVLYMFESYAEYREWARKQLITPSAKLI